MLCLCRKAFALIISSAICVSEGGTPPPILSLPPSCSRLKSSSHQLFCSVSGGLQRHRSSTYPEKVGSNFPKPPWNYCPQLFCLMNLHTEFWSAERTPPSCRSQPGNPLQLAEELVVTSLEIMQLHGAPSTLWCMVWHHEAFDPKEVLMKTAQWHVNAGFSSGSRTGLRPNLMS